MTRVLVTGATGFVGRRLCELLVAQGHEVHVVVREGSPRASTLAEIAVISHDIKDDGSGVEHHIRAVAPDCIFHLATLFIGVHQPADVGALVDANVRFGALVAQASADIGAKLVHITSSWQHFEGAQYSPVSFYAATKQAFSDLVTYFEVVSGMATVEVCLFDTYGPKDDRGKIVSGLFGAAKAGRSLEMSSGYQLINLLHVDDVARAIAIAAQGPAGAKYVVRAADSLTLRELASLIAETSHLPLNIEWGARPERPREMRDDWLTPIPPPGWAPLIPIRIGLTEVWESIDGFE